MSQSNLCPRCGEKLVVADGEIKESIVEHAEYCAISLFHCDKCHWTFGMGMLLDGDGKRIGELADSDVLNV